MESDAKYHVSINQIVSQAEENARLKQINTELLEACKLALQEIGSKFVTEKGRIALEKLVVAIAKAEQKK